MKIIFSHGHGRLHFFSAARIIKEKGAAIRIISGWRPDRLPAGLVDFLGRMVGRKELSKRLAVRNFDELKQDEVISDAVPEFLNSFLLGFSRLRLMDRERIMRLSWLYLGYASRRFLQKGYNIFHVRGGAGQGGAIRTAKKNGMVTVADFSIAHPLTMQHYLDGEYAHFGQVNPYRAASPFWKLITKDCEDADYILANSDFVKRSLIDAGFNAGKVKVIYWGVREDFIGIKQDWTSGSTLKLLFTGGFNLRKGARLLILLMNKLEEAGIRAELDVVGQVDEDLEWIKSKYSVPASVRFHGSVLQEELRNYLAAADIYVFPTFSEGCAQSAMEAMAAGLPVVTTENCGLPLKDEEHGLLFPPGDLDALIGKIVWLKDRPEEREKMGKNASDLIRNHFLWTHYGDNTVAFFKEITHDKN